MMQTRVKRLLWGGGAVGALSVMLAAQRLHLGDGVRAEPDTDGVQDANDRFYAGLNLMLEGDLSGVEEAWSHADDVTLMDPFGGRQEGWPAVLAEFQRNANALQGGEVHPEGTLVRANHDVAYVVCTEAGHHATLDGKRVKVEHRATNVFRREGGEWRMVHHHTDAVSRLQKARKEAER